MLKCVTTALGTFWKWNLGLFSCFLGYGIRRPIKSGQSPDVYAKKEGGCLGWGFSGGYLAFGLQDFCANYPKRHGSSHVGYVADDVKNCFRERF
jgi:hypothetical protein